MDNTRALLRRRLLSDIYDKMSEEDRKLYVLMTLQDTEHSEIMKAIKAQDSKLNAAKEAIERNNWKTNFLTDLGANAIWDSLLFIGRKLFK